ncbi:MAG: 3-deoxy-manno-octulosonate cytidylyltransferase [Gammaproteobacteria bacterium]|uniref:3-deoxy-manno-octulosonate cytidylyltransferase n=1 Tax=Rhodoferax sp. TaxID=50421 RepID=UPI0017BEAF59|nr:3-deoxy-manno-octulosonate cytidylyltransferase [Rhodoferax sp.]MBU3898884.1 3-deoxy-manno-octulosonate cytidylyltransferase [Gammaproteobacteria bacterium]MBA3059505.1 3-deoxy-manno-octulosonate cytidylyltransferase [Rhodoferax sp.]MBU3999075.1 3-deoxy-manno-octulosonate cytidylyltransferase [Gammaproteobacteria bacterium]MBU4019360.1 3-deoxy-manno-octulosonate cytidylyltransferase [Gammaproteobacteria bacterium]MBU4081924.1 3-deoxy-manno-octulosonate cytidylyltransferase [Gammaproteobacte
MTYTVLIPARLASTRLPNKPLADIGGAPMVVRVAQRVLSGWSPTAGVRVVVAGDSPLIIQACQAHGIEAVLTRTDHPSGSDRLAQACTLLGLDDEEIVVNVQGDEPLIDPSLVAAVADLLLNQPLASMSTAAHAISSEAEFNNRNVVKVVLDAQQLALYFSRAPIPCWRDQPLGDSAALPSPAPLRHIGLYAYRVGFLRRFPAMTQAPLEVTESLEQLRALWHGHRIAVHIATHAPGPGVDTPEDLERVRRLFGA